MASHCSSSFASEIGTFLKYRYELIGGLALKTLFFPTVFFSLGFTLNEPYPSSVLSTFEIRASAK